MSRFISLLLVIFSLTSLTLGHQGLFEPKDLIRGPARNGRPEWFQTNEAPFPCKYNDINAAGRDYPVNQRVYKPGDTFNLVWPRNNHVGGFVAVTLVPYEQSGNKATMENPDNVIMYACADNGRCTGNGQYNSFNGPAVCSQQQNGNCVVCTLRVTIPSHVRTGTYTVQWRLFGHFDSSGVPNRALMDYATCLDLKIENANPTARTCPVMDGDNCEHFKGVTDINQMLGGERETGNRNDRNSFVDRGVPARVTQCRANPPAAPPATNNNNNNNNNRPSTTTTTTTNGDSLAHLTSQVDKMEKSITSILSIVRQIQAAVQPQGKKRRSSKRQNK